jgi:hypothetical protein
MAMKRFMQLVALLCVSYTFAFQPVGPRPSTIARTALKNGKGDDEEESLGWNPIRALSEAIGSIDDVIDDFMFKRMGNGEVFYGKRKINPSGRDNTEGSYNGMGMSDKGRIDESRERKEEFLEQRRRQAEERERS